MNIKRLLVTTFITFIVATSMAYAKDDLRAAMEAANTEWLAAYNGLNGQAFPAMYAKDAVILPPGAQPINGPEAIGQFWSERIKPGNRKNHTFEIVSVESEGNRAYEVARWTFDLVNDNGEVTKKAGNEVFIFEKQPDGKWLIKVQIFNAN